MGTRNDRACLVDRRLGGQPDADDCGAYAWSADVLPFGFLTELNARKLTEASSHGRAQWKLLTDLAYHSASRGMIVVPTGFVTDFASVPRMPVVFWLAGDTAHASAVIHDYLVRVLYPACKISWGQAADVFGEAMAHEGVPAWRRWIMRQAVAGANPANQWEPSA